ncbi:MAG: SPOR domain-containing protein [Termitinemataceae bacterium]
MEKKQLLYVITSVGLCLILFITGALWYVSQKKSVAVPPLASINQTPIQATPEKSEGLQKATETQNSVQGPGAGSGGQINPTEWVKNPESVQQLQTPPAGVAPSRGDVIIVYGDNTVTSKTTTLPSATPTDPNTIVIQVPSTKEISPTSTTVSQTAGTLSSTTANTPRLSAQNSSQVTRSTSSTQTAQKTTSGSTSSTGSTQKAGTPKLYTDYWVQTGSYSTKARAETVKEQLASKGIPSLLELKELNGKTYYRVRLGPYTSKNEAEYWLSLVKSLDGFADSYISTMQVKR